MTTLAAGLGQPSWWPLEIGGNSQAGSELATSAVWSSFEVFIQDFAGTPAQIRTQTVISSSI
jgi:hypothetical protein